MAIGTLSVLFSLVGCSFMGTETPAPAPEPAVVAPEPVVSEAGKLPVDYPILSTTAKAGDMVLAPSREFFDKAVAEGMDKATFTWYMAEMVEPGAGESKVKGLAGTEFSIPNSLIIAIPKGQTAAVGDVLLGHWESGSGMKRAIVVEGGTPEAPKVRYIDGEFKAEDAPDTWQANRFRKVEPGAPGVTVACKADGDKIDHGILVSATPKKLLSLGFAGALHVFDTADCMPIAPMTAVKAGDKVQIPYLGEYREATVTRVDGLNGRVLAKFEFGGAEKEEAVGFTDVASTLDGYGQGFVFGERAPGEDGAARGGGKAKGPNRPRGPGEPAKVGEGNNGIGDGVGGGAGEGKAGKGKGKGKAGKND